MELSPTRAEVNVAHLRQNVRMLIAHSGEAEVMGVVKADAYGHGAVRIVEALRNEGIHHFAVATVPEAIRIRNAGIDDPILVFAAPLPEYLPAYVAHRLGVTVSSIPVAEAVMRVARDVGPLHVHLKVDTGMGRIGCQPDEAPALVRQLERAPGVRLAGLWTHFANEDGPDAEAQQAQFSAFLSSLGGAPAPVHMHNSGAMLSGAHANLPLRDSLVRLGLALYGLTDPGRHPAAEGLRPLLRLISRVTHIKSVEAGTPISYRSTWCAPNRTRIATIGAGYGDGYPRLLSNRAVVSIGGHRIPVVGMICMDMMMVDLGPEGCPSISPGDEVVLFGEGGPTTAEVAQWANTITYEICCHLTARVPRIYVET